MSFGDKKNRIKIVHLKKPMEKGLAGMVMAKFFKENIGIVVDRNEERGIDYSFACIASSLDGKVPRIILQDDFFYDIKRGSDEARTILFHEIGHYYYGDYKAGQTDDQRLEALRNGEVLEMEIKADAFAASYLGFEKAIHGLQQLKESIIDQAVDDEAKAFAIEELEKRIALLQKEV